MQFDFLK